MNTTEKDENETSVEKRLSEGFKQTLRKAKKRTLLRTVLVSFCTALVLLVSTVFFVVPYAKEQVDRNGRKLLDQLKARYLVKGANQFMDSFRWQNGIFNGEMEFYTFKYVNGKRVYTGTWRYMYGMQTPDDTSGEIAGQKFSSGGGNSLEYTAMTQEQEDYLPRYNHAGVKQMEFYDPFVDYNNHYKDDLKLLDQIGKDKYVEMALSFDKSYSLDEVRTMMSAGPNPVWYWANSQKEEARKANSYQRYTEKGKNGEDVVTENFPSPIYEDNAIGFHAVNHYGEQLPDPEQFFIPALKKARMQSDYDIMAGPDKILSKDDIHILGVVVTGEPETLKLLRNRSYIKASSLGVVTDKY
ncbi:anti sigma factor C-terminal domain-containing protein [Paenibacillus sp. RC84]|uniref:anti sigma factor C-terminal domain-containing protein n=1 Tax=Paenibacillus sp. RC84 TaxID=3156252 RepID=UPI0035195A9E